MTGDGSHTVELEVRLNAPPEEVFPYLTEPERYVLWQGVKAELDPRPGGVYRVWMDANTVASGEFVEVEPAHRVVFTWGWEGNEGVPPGSTTVELTLEADGDGTVLSLRHTGLPDGEAAAMHEEGWRHFTARLALAARRTDP
ncbi:MAG: SRPBCC domain-containing protein [Actinomycetota bacterium]|nr:SRPBCC domain-containing protein [Actinomycetota bacterium]